MKIPAPNRIAVYLTAAASLLGAAAPIVADLDFSSTVGVLGGLTALTAVVNKWLTGWQQLERAEQQDALHHNAVTREAAARAEQVAQATAPRSGIAKSFVTRP